MEQINYIMNEVTALSTDTIYVALLEKIFVTMIQIALSILIFKGIQKHKLSYYFVAMLLHTAVGFIFTILYQYSNFYFAEIFLLVAAVASMLYMRYAIKQEKANLTEDEQNKPKEMQTNTACDSQTEDNPITVS